MLEKIGHIKNPLTVIAMFAGIAELSGTVVLPFLEKPIQETYVWFLMGFPVLMVYLFYKTLWRDHTVLYAPSDFQKDESFMQAHFKSYSDGHPGADLSDLPEEIETAPVLPTNTETQEVEELPATPDTSTAEVDSSAEHEIENPENLRRFIFRTSKTRILSRMARMGGGAYHRDVEPKQLPNVKFDGVVESASAFCVVSFILRDNEASPILRRAHSKMKEANLFWNTLSEEEKTRFFLHVAILRVQAEQPVNEGVVMRLQRLAARFPFRIELADYGCERGSLRTKHLN